MDEKSNTDSGTELKTLTKKSLNEKYPYLTAFVGFMALYILFRLIVGLVIALPLTVFPYQSSYIVEMVLKNIFLFIVQPIIGYYVFKYVVIKHILPYVQN